MSKWISVREKMPEENITCVAINSIFGWREIGQMNGPHFITDRDVKIPWNEISHWFIFPEITIEMKGEWID